MLFTRLVVTGGVSTRGYQQLLRQACHEDQPGKTRSSLKYIPTMKRED